MSEGKTYLADRTVSDGDALFMDHCIRHNNQAIVNMGLQNLTFISWGDIMDMLILFMSCSCLVGCEKGVVKGSSGKGDGRTKELLGEGVVVKKVGRRWW
jgi:hypothetical protein